MKNILKSLGMAIVYFLLFFGMQLVVNIIFGVTVAVNFISQNAGNMDMAALTEKLTESIINYATPVAAVSNILTILVLFLIFKGTKKKLTIEADIRRLDIKALILPALLGIALYFGVSMLLGLLPIPETLIDQYSAASDLLFGGNEWILVLSVAIIAPITEEIIFRGMILSRLRRSMPTVVAAIVSSIIFGLAHFNWIWSTYAFVLGLVLCYVCIKYRSIVASMVVHIIFNLLGVLASNFENLEIPSFFIIGLLVIGLAGSAVIMVAIDKLNKENVPVAMDAHPDLEELAEHEITKEQE